MAVGVGRIVALRVRITMVKKTFSTADARHRVDCRLHAVGSVFARSSTIFLGSERILKIWEQIQMNYCLLPNLEFVFLYLTMDAT